MIQLKSDQKAPSVGVASVSLPELEDSFACLANILSNDTADAAPINGSQRQVLTHWKRAIIWKRTNIKQNKVHRRRRILPDSPGRKPDCINPDAATIGYSKGSKDQQERPWWPRAPAAALGSGPTPAPPAVPPARPPQRASATGRLHVTPPGCLLRAFLISLVPKPQDFFKVSVDGRNTSHFMKKLQSLIQIASTFPFST